MKTVATTAVVNCDRNRSPYLGHHTSQARRRRAGRGPALQPKPAYWQRIYLRPWIVKTGRGRLCLAQPRPAPDPLTQPACALRMPLRLRGVSIQEGVDSVHYTWQEECTAEVDCKRIAVPVCAHNHLYEPLAQQSMQTPSKCGWGLGPTCGATCLNTTRARCFFHIGS